MDTWAHAPWVPEAREPMGPWTHRPLSPLAPGTMGPLALETLGPVDPWAHGPLGVAQARGAIENFIDNAYGDSPPPLAFSDFDLTLREEKVLI